MPTLDDVLTWENLLLAFRRAAAGRRGRPGVAAFEHGMEDELLRLREEIRTRRYRPGVHVSFVVHEPKRRLISAAPFRDRVVHHALCNVIEPVFERTFVADSFANRVGMGTHRALDAAQRLARRHSLVLQCDVRQFFPSIDHEVLRVLLCRKLTDAGLQWLAARILAAGTGLHDRDHEMVFFPGDDLFAVNRPRGLPIGNLTSQFWANVYLSPLDHFIKRELRCPGYVRYVDDLLLFGDDAREVAGWLRLVSLRLERLRLVLHPSAHVRPVTEAFPFLGFVVHPSWRRLKRRKVVHARRRLRSLARAHDLGRIPISRVSAAVRGWAEHARHGNTAALRAQVLGSLRLGH